VYDLQGRESGPRRENKRGVIEERKPEESIDRESLIGPSEILWGGLGGVGGCGGWWGGVGGYKTRETRGGHCWGALKAAS